MKQHIFTGLTPPTVVPAGIGHHFVDTVAGKMYFSVGTSSLSDWISLDDSNLIEDAIVAGVTTKAPSQNAVFNALNSTGVQVPRTIAAAVSVLSGFYLIRSQTRIANNVTLKIQNNATLKLI
jgi:hypothetical protein